MPMPAKWKIVVQLKVASAELPYPWMSRWPGKKGSKDEGLGKTHLSKSRGKKCMPFRFHSALLDKQKNYLL